MIKAQQFWDQQASIFDENEKQFETHYEEIIAQTKAYLKAGDRVLDYGCATGTKTLRLSEGVKHIVGLDFSGEMIRRANQKKDHTGVRNVEFLQGTISDENFREAFFDTVIAYAIIHLTDKPGKEVQRIWNLLKPGGCFISVTPCFKDKTSFKTGLQVLGYRLKRILGISPLHLNRFSFSGYEKLLCKFNFKILNSEKRMMGMTVAFVVAEKC